MIRSAVPGLPYAGIVIVHDVVHVIGQVLLSRLVCHPVGFGRERELGVAVNAAGVIAAGSGLGASDAGNSSGLEQAEALSALGAGYLLRCPQQLRRNSSTFHFRSQYHLDPLLMKWISRI